MICIIPYNRLLSRDTTGFPTLTHTELFLLDSVQVSHPLKSYEVALPLHDIYSTPPPRVRGGNPYNPRWHKRPQITIDGVNVRHCIGCNKFIPEENFYFLKRYKTFDCRCILCRRELQNQHPLSLESKAQQRDKRKLREAQLKEEVLTYYSKDQILGCSCQGCKIQNLKFLTIDHINGGGCKHREEIKNQGGHKFYLWLKQQKYPKGYQTLCFNCNSAKGAFGICPHELGEEG